MRLESPILEVLSPSSMKIEEVSRDDEFIHYRITYPMPRDVSLAGLFPILTFPC